MAQRLRAWAEKDGRGYPDWAVRYAPIARRLRRIQPRFVVEIGANQNGLARFWKGFVIAVDVDVAQVRQARAALGVPGVVADGTALPFADGSLPCWAAVEVLEHVPAERRAAVLGELARVLAADGAGVLTFPSGEGAREAEGVIRDAYKDFTGERLRWLEEHDEHGLPDAMTVKAELQGVDPKDRRIRPEKNANLGVWTWMWRVLLCGWPGRGNGVAQAVLRVATPLLTRIHWGRCYRTMIWLEPGRRS